MKRFSKTLFLCLVSLVALSGCKQRPSDWPDTFPCKITLTNDGAPAKNVIVIMNPVTGSGGNWGVGGVTDDQGVLNVKTSMQDYVENGAPGGKYKIMMTYSPPPFDDSNHPDLQNLEGPAKDAMYQRLAKEHADKASAFIPKAFKSKSTTPIEVEVTADGKAEVIVEFNDYR